METPDEDVIEINANEVTSIPQKKTKQHKRKRGMANDDFIPSDYEEIVELDETHLNRKKRKAKVVDEEELIVTSEYHDGSPKGSREIITPGVDLEDGIIKTTQNTIRDRLRRNNLVDEGHTFLLNVKQLYKPTEGQEKYQIRKPHQLHIQNLKALIRHNPYAHVVDYLVLVDPMEVPTKDAFDRSKCFEYKYYVIGGNHSAEARRELMQEYPNNPLFETVRCVIYVGLTDGEAKLLAWDHNTDNEYRMSMTFIQRVRFIHNEFSVICGGDRSNVDAKFRKECCMEIGFPIDEESVKVKNRKGSDAFRVVDSYFQLGFKTGQIWDLVDEIFNLWENIGIKNQKVRKYKPLIGSTSKTGPEIKNLPDDMTITPWRTMQGVKDEKLVIAILSRVRSGELSMEEMCDEFKK
jgi:hypothetical protein